MLLWLCVINDPTVLNCPLKVIPPVFCTVIVIANAVSGAVLLSLTPSSSKNGLLELITGVTVTPPVPVTTGFTVRDIVVVCVSVPLTPVIVTVAAPRGAVLDAVKVRVLVPVVETGLKAAVTPVGSPLALRATTPVNPPEGVTVIVLLLVPPCATVALAGLADKEKLGVLLITVRTSVAVCVSVPLTPVTVTVAAPTAAVADAVKVKELAPVVVEAGLKLAVTPLGKPLAVKATLPANPLSRLTVIVLVAVPPWATLALAAARTKSGVAVPVTVSAIVALWVNVPLVPTIEIFVVPAGVVD